MPRHTLLRPAWPLVACLAVSLLWPASEVWYAWASVPIGGRVTGVTTGPGWFALFVRPVGPARLGTRPSADAGRITPAMRGYLTYSPVYSRPDDFRFWCPTWVASCGAGVWMAGLLVSRLRRPDPDDLVGRCSHCGYDLRASPDRCPECGTAPDPTSSSV